MSTQLFKQIYFESIRSFWYFPTFSLVLFIAGSLGLGKLISVFLTETPTKGTMTMLFYVYEGSIVLMIPFLLYLFRRFLIKKRADTYEKKLIALIVDYGLNFHLIDALQEEINEVLGSQKEKHQFNGLLMKLSIIPVLFILLKKYPVLSISSLVTPLIVLVFLFVLNYFLPNEWVKSLQWATSKKNHYLSFIYSELDYMKEVMDSPFLLGISREKAAEAPSARQEDSEALEKKLGRKRMLKKFLAFILSEEYETPDKANNLVEEWPEATTVEVVGDEEIDKEQEANDLDAAEEGAEDSLEEESDDVFLDSDFDFFAPLDVNEDPYSAEIAVQLTEMEEEEARHEDHSELRPDTKAEEINE